MTENIHNEQKILKIKDIRKRKNIKN